MSDRRRNNSQNSIPQSQKKASDEVGYVSKQKKSGFAEHFGLILIGSFLLVTLLFIILNIRSDQPDESNPPADPVITSDPNIQNPEHTSQGSDPSTAASPDQSEENPIEDEPEPEITGIIYLTFDDGPSLAISPGILDILAEEGVKATFFMLPYSGGDEVFRRVIDEGHEIGNHSYSHDYAKLYNGTVSAFKDDIFRARNFIYDNFGYTTTTFRFPGGSGDQPASIRNPRINAIHDLGYRYFDWDIDTNDWRRTSTPESIIEDVLTNTRSREHVIILMHDMYNRTLEALPGMIQGLREQGYEFDTLNNHPGR